MSSRRYYIVLLSGGVGSRMGADRPKQFLNLAGAPVLEHCLRSFINQNCSRPFILVAHPDFQSESRLIADRVMPAGELNMIAGGATRHDSTLNGLRLLLESTSITVDDIIMIHDVARPFISNVELERLRKIFDEQPDCQIASLAGAMHETIVQASAVPGVMQHSLDRNHVATIKTPQAIRGDLLHRLIEEKPQPDHGQEFTDLLTWGEACQIPGHLVQAGPTNLKITRAEDLPLLAMLHQHYQNPDEVDSLS